MGIAHAGLAAKDCAHVPKFEAKPGEVVHLNKESDMPSWTTMPPGPQQTDGACSTHGRILPLIGTYGHIPVKPHYEDIPHFKQTDGKANPWPNEPITAS